MSIVSRAASGKTRLQLPIFSSTERQHLDLRPQMTDTPMNTKSSCRLLGCASRATRQGFCLTHFLEHHQQQQHPQVKQQQLAVPLPSFCFDLTLTSYLARKTEKLPRLQLPDDLQHFSTPKRQVASPSGYYHHHEDAIHPLPSMSPCAKSNRIFSVDKPVSYSPTLLFVSQSPNGSDQVVTPTKSWKSNKGRCRTSGCTSTARRKGLCVKHGGRHYCKSPGCTKCAHRGGFCISHGGGKRCRVANCTKSAQSGGACYSHGGGKRCCISNCLQAARTGGFCIQHGKLMRAQQIQRQATI